MTGARVRVIAYAVGALSLGLGILGATPASVVRPILAGVVRVAQGGCPFGYDRPTSPAQRERANLNFAATHRGERRAAARPALGFVLDRTTRAQVLSAMDARGVHCRAASGMADLSCENVPSRALASVSSESPARDVWFTFGANQQLLSVVAISKAPAPAVISAAFAATRQDVAQLAGEATNLRGDADPRALARGVLRQASAEFRFRNYYALARATNLGRGFVLTEEYRSLPD